MKINSYRDLTVWQLAMQLTEDVYRITSTFPNKEIYALTNQLQRAAVSIPSDFAEGHACSSTKDYLRFISIAMGSLAELETQVELSKDLDTLINQNWTKCSRKQTSWDVCSKVCEKF